MKGGNTIKNKLIFIILILFIVINLSCVTASGTNDSFNNDLSSVNDSRIQNNEINDF